MGANFVLLDSAQFPHHRDHALTDSHSGSGASSFLYLSYFLISCTSVLRTHSFKSASVFCLEPPSELSIACCVFVSILNSKTFFACFPVHSRAVHELNFLLQVVLCLLHIGAPNEVLHCVLFKNQTRCATPILLSRAHTCPCARVHAHVLPKTRRRVRSPPAAPSTLVS